MIFKELRSSLFLKMILKKTSLITIQFVFINTTTDGKCGKWTQYKADHIICGGESWTAQPCEGDFGGSIAVGEDEENQRLTQVGIAIAADKCKDKSEKDNESDEKNPGFR